MGILIHKTCGPSGLQLNHNLDPCTLHLAMACSTKRSHASRVHPFMRHISSFVRSSDQVPRSYSSQKSGICGSRTKAKKSMN